MTGTLLVQQAAFEGSADAGYDTRRYDAMDTVWVIRQQSIVYLAPLLYYDVIELTTWVSDPTANTSCAASLTNAW